jgi:hypothetical protein
VIALTATPIAAAAAATAPATQALGRLHPRPLEQAAAAAAAAADDDDAIVHAAVAVQGYSQKPS